MSAEPMTPARQFMAMLGAQQFLLETLYAASLAQMTAAEAVSFVALVRKGLASLPVSAAAAPHVNDEMLKTARDIQVVVQTFLHKAVVSADEIRAGRVR